MSTQDALIIGGGHNGLVCAAYLAEAGLKVTVLERRAVLGGAAVTEEFHPGFRNSTASYTVSLLNPQVVANLRLHQHGLRVVERPYSNFLPLPDGSAFRLGGEVGLENLKKLSARDAQRLPDYYAMLERVVAVLRELISPNPLASCSTAGSSATRLKPRWAGTRSSAISPALTRPAAPMCSCIMCLAR